MDKRPVYPGAIPLDLDTLTPQRNTEIALGFMMQAAFGTSTIIDGLAVTQTATPSMAVLVGPGSIIFNTTVDTLPTGFGSLPVDNADPLVKIGINLTATTMSVLTAPGTAGQSQNWLVEAQFLEADGTPVVLPFYNAANPSVPYTGPSNSGATSNTARTNRVQLQWKGGTAATTGTQNTPTPDAGWVGVAVVTVANGQVSITNANITPYSLAPTVGTKLGVTRTRLFSNLNVYVATTGSDTANSGLSASSPFLTLQKAWNYIIQSVDLNGYQVTVNVANGTYSSGVLCCGEPIGAIGAVPNSPGSPNPPVVFLGNTTTPSNVVITVSGSNCFQASNGAVISVQGFQLQATSGAPSDYVQQGTGLYAAFGGSICFNKIIFAACSSHIVSTVGSIVETQGTGCAYTISGNATAHLNAFAGGYITIADSTVTLSGTPAFSTAFAVASSGGNMLTGNMTFSGSATGVRYSAFLNGTISTGGGGATYLPGNASGTTATGGQYA